MYPILGRYGSFFLYSYTVAMGLGLAAGIGLTAWLERRAGRREYGWLDGLIVGLAAGMVGGRIGFVWSNWAYFQEQPGEIVLLSHGGLSYHGVLLAGFAAFWAWSRRGGCRFLDEAGKLAPGLALATAFGWFACWLEGCAYGSETVFGPLAADLPDSYGVFGLRYQSQLMGVVLALTVFVLTLGLRPRVRAANLFWLTLALLSASRVPVSLLRGDEMPMVGQLRLDTLLELSLVAISLVGVTVSRRPRKNPTRASAGDGAVQKELSEG